MRVAGRPGLAGVAQAVGRHGAATPTAAALIGLAVYVRTLMPGVSFGDWAEIQTVPHVLGISHPTGYPTYVLVAWLAELLPLGSVAFRANLLSAVLVAATLATLTVIARRLQVRATIALGAALGFAAVGTVWAAATVAEVNPLHLFLAALLAHLALRWADDRDPRDLLLGGLLVGLSLGNHLLTLFVAPFLIASVIWAGRRELRRRPWLLPATAGMTLLGLCIYLYIPLAAAQSPPLAYNHPVTLDSFLWLVTGTQFRFQFDFFSARGPGEFAASIPALWTLLERRATLVLPILGLIGFLPLVRMRPAFGLACLGILAGGLYVWATYQRLEHYLLVPMLMLAISAAVALEWGARGLAWLTRRLARVDASPLVGPAAMAFALLLAITNWAAADRSGDRSGEEYVDAVFGALPANAAIVTYWDPSAPLWYGQHVEGRRPDLLIVDDSNIVYENWATPERRIRSLICDRPVFLMRVGERDLAPIRQQYRLTPFLTVRVSALGPSAAVEQVIYRVEPILASTCTGQG